VVILLARQEDVILGGRRGKVCEALKTEGPQIEAGCREKTPETNVVRLPRDWLGPREELVPFGPRAEAASAAATTAPSAAAAAPSASDFWGEESAALQHALQGPDPISVQNAETQAPSNPDRPEEPGQEAGLYFPFLAQARSAGRALALSFRLGARRGGRKVAALAVLVVAGASVAVFTSSRSTPSVGAPTVHNGSRLLGAALATAASRVRVPLVGQLLTVRRQAVRRKPTPARPHRVRPVRHPRASSPVQISTVSHSGSTGLPASVGYRTPAAGSSAYVPPAATSSPSSAASTSSSPASSQSQPAGPTGAGAILGPGHCSC
jgi:hypothetical protein